MHAELGRFIDVTSGHGGDLILHTVGNLTELTAYNLTLTSVNNGGTTTAANHATVLTLGKGIHGKSAWWRF